MRVSAILARGLGLALVLLFASPAGARDCQLSFVQDNAPVKVPKVEFFECLLAEIEDLKRDRDRLRALVGEYEKALGEVPVHYQNADGKVAVEEGRKIGSAGFVLTSRQLGGAASLPLDPQVVGAVCAPPTGCAATLALRRLGIQGRTALGTDLVGPCQCTFDVATGNWTCGAGCGPEGPVAGVDGNAALLEAASGAETILRAGPGCLLTDSDLQRPAMPGQPAFAPDRSIGLYLIADPGLRSDGATRFDCTLDLR